MSIPTTKADGRWLREMPTMRDCAIVQDERKGPYVAFATLNLPDETQPYIGMFDYNKHFGPQGSIMRNSTIAPFLRFRPEYNRTDVRMQVFGWFADPAKSTRAKADFVRLSRPFFPAAPAREPMLQSLANNVAEIASAFNQGMMDIIWRATDGFAEPFLHHDVGDYTGIANINMHATQHYPLRRGELKKLTVLRDYPGGIKDYLPTEEMKPHVLCPEGQNFSVWRGLGKKRPSLHGLIDCFNGTRVTCLFAMFSNDLATLKAPLNREWRQYLKENNKYADPKYA